MIRYVKLVLATVPIMFSLYGQAQNNDTSSVAQYFDDGRISKARNVTKFNLTSAIMGDFSISHEFVIGKKIGLEAGVGFLPFYLPLDYYTLLSGKRDIVNHKGGYSWFIMPRFYLVRKGPEGAYIGFMYRTRSYNCDSLEVSNTSSSSYDYQGPLGKTIIYKDYPICFGAQLFVGSRMMIDYNIGVGFRFRKVIPFDPTLANTSFSGGTYNLTSISGVVMPLNIKLAYTF